MGDPIIKTISPSIFLAPFRLYFYILKVTQRGHYHFGATMLKNCLTFPTTIEDARIGDQPIAGADSALKSFHSIRLAPCFFSVDFLLIANRMQ